MQVDGVCSLHKNPRKYITLPANISELNNFMCGGLNRESQLCGACKEGYGPAVLTYHLPGAHCSSGTNYGLALYLLLEFLPITVLYLIIVALQVSATSGPLNTFVFSAQIIVTTADLNDFPYMVYTSSWWSHVVKKVLITSYGFCNLDFFRSVIPPFCVSDRISTLHALALQYLPAFHPLLLIVLTYTLIELHDKNFRVIMWLWRPFHKCLAPFVRRWDPKASIVSSFATFMILAYNKRILTSVKLLHTTRVTDIRGKSSQYLLFAPTVPSFSSKHLPFAILAITVLSTFIALPPLLLVLYPTKLFQKILGCIKIRWHPLHAFVDVFQGCYRNRTDGTHDYRYFVAL